MRVTRDALRLLAADWRFTLAAVTLLSLTIGDEAGEFLTILGVMPEGFDLPRGTEIQ